LIQGVKRNETNKDRNKKYIKYTAIDVFVRDFCM